MITKLYIKNFQSHPNSTLKLHPGVNVVIGSSDSGKTAVLRALRWAVWNKPLGDAFRSDWGGDTSVTIETDKASVQRFKGKGGDKYQIEEHDEDPGNPPQSMEFKAFGTSPPEEVTRLLNLKDLNIQGQLDSPFLLSQNPGEVARYFNRVAKIDQIDLSRQTVESWLRKIEQAITTHKDQSEKHEKVLEEYKYLDKLEQEIEVLEDMETRANQGHNNIRKLEQALESLEKVEEEIASQISVVRAERIVTDTIYLFEQKDSLREQTTRLSGILTGIHTTVSQIKEYQEDLPDKKQVDSLLTLMDRRDSLSKTHGQLELLEYKVRVAHAQIKEQKIKLENLEETWHAEFPEVCPLCGKAQ